MPLIVDRLVERFQDAYTSGAPIDVMALLDEAGDQREELERRLAGLVDELGRRPLPRPDGYAV